MKKSWKINSKTYVYWVKSLYMNSYITSIWLVLLDIFDMENIFF